MSAVTNKKMRMASLTLRCCFLFALLMSSACHRKEGDSEQHGYSHAKSFYERTGNSDRVIVFVHRIIGQFSDTWSCSLRHSGRSCSRTTTHSKDRTST